MMKSRWRLWSVLAVTPIVVLGLVGYANAPRLVTWLARLRQPIPLGSVAVLSGAAMAVSHPASLTVSAAPAVVRAVAEGASGRWIPGFLLGDGQTGWGPLLALPGLGWELRVRSDQVPAQLHFQATPLELSIALAAVLHRSLGNQWTCDLHFLHVHESPATASDPGMRRFAFLFSGDLDLRTSSQTTRFSIQRASGFVLISPGKLRVQFEECRASLPQLGSDDILVRTLVESQANLWLDRHVNQKPWPAWLPLDARIDVDCGPKPRQEF